jgi:uncharacterized spore protein YtfJ
MSTPYQTQRSDRFEGAFLERIADHLGDIARAKTIFAEPVDSDGVTVIPVGRAGWGFGGGGGRHKEGEEGTGGGGGMLVTPVGYIEMKKGHSTFRRISSGRTIFPVLLAFGAFLLMARRRRARWEEEE